MEPPKKRKFDEIYDGLDSVVPAKRKKIVLSLPNRHVLTQQQDRKLVSSVQKFIRHTWGYKKLDDNGTAILSGLAENAGATFDMAFCIWRDVGSFNGMKNENYLRGKINSIQSGLFLANLKVDVPPLNIVRRFLSMKLHWEKTRIKKLIQAFTNGGPPPECPEDLDPRIFGQFLQIAASDSFTGKAEQQRSLAQSKKFENDVQSWCREQGLTFKTEQDIRNVSKKMPTPDILLDFPITLNGHENIRWLEVKDYYGSSCANQRTVQKWKKQLRRYRDCYGEGALVFRYGFCLQASEEISFLCIDASDIFETKSSSSD